MPPATLAAVAQRAAELQRAYVEHKDMTEEVQRRALESLVDEVVQELGLGDEGADRAARFLDDTASIFRFLRRSRYSVPAALDLLRANLIWRLNASVDMLSLDSLDPLYTGAPSPSPSLSPSPLSTPELERGESSQLNGFVRSPSPVRSASPDSGGEGGGDRTPLFLLPSAMHDKLHRPTGIIYLRGVERTPDGSLDALKEYIVCMFEVCRRYLKSLNDQIDGGRRGDDEDVDGDGNGRKADTEMRLQMSIVLDLEGSGINNLELELLPFMVDLLKNHFPGMVGAIFLLHYGWMYSGMWQLAKRVVPETALARIFFPSIQDLKQFFDDPQLPQAWGGSLPLDLTSSSGSDIPRIHGRMQHFGPWPTQTNSQPSSPTQERPTGTLSRRHSFDSVPDTFYSAPGSPRVWSRSMTPRASRPPSPVHELDDPMLMQETTPSLKRKLRSLQMTRGQELSGGMDGLDGFGSSGGRRQRFASEPQNMDFLAAAAKNPKHGSRGATPLHSPSLARSSLALPPAASSHAHHHHRHQSHRHVRSISSASDLSLDIPANGFPPAAASADLCYTPTSTRSSHYSSAQSSSGVSLRPPAAVSPFSTRASSPVMGRSSGGPGLPSISSLQNFRLVLPQPGAEAMDETDSEASSSGASSRTEVAGGRRGEEERKEKGRGEEDGSAQALARKPLSRFSPSNPHFGYRLPEPLPSDAASTPRHLVLYGTSGEAWGDGGGGRFGPSSVYYHHPRYPRKRKRDLVRTLTYLFLLRLLTANREIRARLAHVWRTFGQTVGLVDHRREAEVADGRRASRSRNGSASSTSRRRRLAGRGSSTSVASSSETGHTGFLGTGIRIRTRWIYLFCILLFLFHRYDAATWVRQHVYLLSTAILEPSSRFLGGGGGGSGGGGGGREGRGGGGTGKGKGTRPLFSCGRIESAPSSSSPSPSFLPSTATPPSPGGFGLGLGPVVGRGIAHLPIPSVDPMAHTRSGFHIRQRLGLGGFVGRGAGRSAPSPRA